ncbi:VOC family protein [Nakamurella deserti]|uniref:VOC family protein n=1 Tax=Nakamurella deserti TaxID=2164074 RepID=UPI000DBE3BF8|nr:glyoxalase [Nakamurella deserti]
MDIRFVAGFGPIGPDPDETHRFWSGTLGLRFDEIAPGHHHARALDGAKVFGLWLLTQAAEATSGVPGRPSHLPVPQAWVEFELASPTAVADGAAELTAAGRQLPAGLKTEPWGQTTARLLSPEGLLVGPSHLPGFHEGTTAA